MYTPARYNTVTLHIKVHLPPHVSTRPTAIQSPAKRQAMKVVLVSDLLEDKAVKHLKHLKLDLQDVGDKYTKLYQNP